MNQVKSAVAQVCPSARPAAAGQCRVFTRHAGYNVTCVPWKKEAAGFGPWRDLLGSLLLKQGGVAPRGYKPAVPTQTFRWGENTEPENQLIY